MPPSWKQTSVSLREFTLPQKNVNANGTQRQQIYKYRSSLAKINFFGEYPKSDPYECKNKSARNETYLLYFCMKTDDAIPSMGGIRV